MLTCPATIHAVRTLADKSVRLTIDTQELPPDTMTELFGLYDKYGFFAFKEIPIIESDLLNIPEPTPEFKEDVSPSKRIRNCLWILWSQKYQTRYPVFEDFYRAQVEKICDFIKSKLD